MYLMTHQTPYQGQTPMLTLNVDVMIKKKKPKKKKKKKGKPVVYRLTNKRPQGEG